ncbi:MarR family winged helix-turn-helix transcriptional regulator [Sphingomonas kyungheensis]|uniref:MarR family transcriptional regulator n=1 Tax=Sphingomonas kyungheensis TaxID=1069987 RepID=A0ABU8H6F2_9SPHN
MTAPVGAEALPDPGQRSFATQVSLIARLLRKRFDERARAMALAEGEALTQAQWRALASIYLHPGWTQKEMAEKLEIGPVAIGQTLDRLEALQWVERRADPGDRRVKRLYATEAAQPVVARLGLLADREDHYAGISLAPEKMQMLTTLLDEVIDSLSKPA